MGRRSPRLAMRVATLVLAAASMMAVGPVVDANTPEPTVVTIAGSLQSELGCPGDWDPACGATSLSYDANDGVWQGTFAAPSGVYDYKGALNSSWDENYGANATFNGASIALTTSGGAVKFYYDHKTHWVTDSANSVIPVAAGSFQSELGCSGDWDPACLRTWLQDPDGDGIYTFVAAGLPAGSYETKVTIDETWDENYGLDGIPNGASIPFVVWTDGSPVEFSFDPTSHVLKVLSDAPNLLKNSGFERDANSDGRPDRWTSDSRFARSSDSVFAGGYAGRHRSAKGATYTVQQSITTAASGAEHQLSGRVNIPWTGDDFTLALRVRWLDGTGKVVDTMVARRYSAPTTGWIRFSKILTSPAGTASAQVQMRASSLSATIYVDSFAFRRV